MLPEDNRFSNDPNEFWPEKLIDPLEGIGFTYPDSPPPPKPKEQEPFRECIRDYAIRGKVRGLQKTFVDGGDPDRFTERGTTLLHECIAHGHLKAAQFMVDLEADVNKCRPRDGVAPLHDAAREGDREAAVFLIRHGATVDARSLQGTTPLMRAATGGHTPVVRCLLALGADHKAVNNEGKTAEMIAKHYRQFDAEQVLAEHREVKAAEAKRREEIRIAQELAEDRFRAEEAIAMAMEAEAKAKAEAERVARFRDAKAARDAITAAKKAEKKQRDEENRKRREELKKLS